MGEGEQGEVEGEEEEMLPPGWLQFETDDGNVYFYNALTEQTTWEFPTA